MTLCIAAVCKGRDDQPAAVMSCDHQVTAGFVSGLYEAKWKGLARGWFCLLADDLQMARELAGQYRVYLRERENEIEPETAIDHLRVPLDSYRRTLMDRLTQERLGVNSAEFLKIGKAQLPEQLFEEIARDLTEIECRVEMLLVGIVQGKIRLYRVVGRLNHVEHCSNFAAIGRGADLAEPSLYQRQYHQFWRVSRALYAVYEAQNHGALAPEVGRNFILRVLENHDGALRESFNLMTSDQVRASEAFLFEKYQELKARPIREVLVPESAWLRPAPGATQLPPASSEEVEQDHGLSTDDPSDEPQLPESS